MRRTQTRTCGELVKCYRVAAGITQEELAERAQVSARTISDIERGGPHKPQRETIERLATALDLSREDRDTLMAATRQRLALPRSPSGAGQYHLPVPPTPLVGRDQEVEAACALLRSSQVQMLTLCGAGGVGKTRLALEIGGRLLDIFPDGVWFCDLAHAIAHVLGLHEAGSQPLEQMLLSYLRGRQTLLLLDNFEHVVAAASLVADLLTACPPVKILVTSRASVHVRGEHEYPAFRWCSRIWRTCPQ